VGSGQENEPHPTTDDKKPLIEKRLVRLLSPFAGRVLLSVLLGFATIASGIGLMATSAYIISAAALHPSIADLQIAIVGVRFFGLSRGVFRYLERLVSHDVTFRLLASWRTWFYQALEPLAPARLLRYHSGDLLSRMIGDIATLESFYVRAIAPPFVALLVVSVVCGLMGAFGPELAWTLLFFLILAGVGLPALTFLLTRRVGPQIALARANLSITIVDGIQGLQDLLASDNARAQLRKVEGASKYLNRQQTGMARLTALQNALGGLLANLSMLSVLVLAIRSVSAGMLDGVLLGVVGLVALTSFEAIFPLPLAAQNYTSNHEAASRLYELVDASPAVTDHTPNLPQTPILSGSARFQLFSTAR
jgi:ATP-binding cassette subfamily C protein CydC